MLQRYRDSCHANYYRHLEGSKGLATTTIMSLSLLQDTVCEGRAGNESQQVAAGTLVKWRSLQRMAAGGGGGWPEDEKGKRGKGVDMRKRLKQNHCCSWQQTALPLV